MATAEQPAVEGLRRRWPHPGRTRRPRRRHGIVSPDDPDPPACIRARAGNHGSLSGAVACRSGSVAADRPLALREARPQSGGPCGSIRIGGWPTAPIRPLGRARSTVMSMPTAIGQEAGGDEGHPAVTGMTFVAPAGASFPQRLSGGTQPATDPRAARVSSRCRAWYPGRSQAFTVMTRPCGPVCTPWRLVGTFLCRVQRRGKAGPSRPTGVRRSRARQAARPRVWVAIPVAAEGGRGGPGPDWLGGIVFHPEGARRHEPAGERGGSGLGVFVKAPRESCLAYPRVLP